MGRRRGVLDLKVTGGGVAVSKLNLIHQLEPLLSRKDLAPDLSTCESHPGQTIVTYCTVLGFATEYSWGILIGEYWGCEDGIWVIEIIFPLSYQNCIWS